MVSALVVVFATLLLGSLLGNLHARPRGKDLYVNGHLVEIVPASHFKVAPHHYWYTWRQKIRSLPKGTTERLGFDPEAVMDVYTSVLLDGLLLRGLSGDGEVPKRAPRRTLAQITEDNWRFQTKARRLAARKLYAAKRAA